MNKIAVIGSGIGLLAIASIANAANKSKELKAKLKLNPMVPNNVNAELTKLQVSGNFPVEVINQSAFDITLRNLFINISHKDENGEWQDLLVQKNGITEVTFKKGVATKLNTIPLTLNISKVPTLLRVFTGKLSRTLLVTTRFEVAGVELDPIQTEIDATSYLQPIINVLNKLGLMNGLNPGMVKSGAGMPLDYQPTGGIGYSANFHFRKIKDASKYSSLIPKPKGQEKEIRKNGSAYETIDDMAQIVATTLDQTKALAVKLTGNTKEQSVKNVYDFLYNHIQYKQDKNGVEELREPAASFAARASGIDCDCFSIFASSILTNMGIGHFIEMCAISPDPWFKHVYVIVPKESKANISQRQNYWVVDPCLHNFDELAPNIINKYDKEMRTVQLSGLDCLCPSKQPEGAFGKSAQKSSVMQPSAAKLNEMALTILEPIRKTLIQTKEQAINNPQSLSLLYNPKEVVAAIDYALKNWADPIKREKALDILAKQDDAITNRASVAGLMGSGAFNGLNGQAYDPTKVYPIIGFSGFGGMEITGFSGLFDSIKKTAGNIASSVKNVAQKAVQAVQNAPSAVSNVASNVANAVKNAAVSVASVVQKINPAMVVARTAYRGLVALNFRGQATDMYNAMQSPQGLKKLQDFWTSTLIGGNWGDLVAAINSGRNKARLLGGFGEVVTVGASVATATPILVKIADVIKSALSYVPKVQSAVEKAKEVQSAVQSVRHLIPNPANNATYSPMPTNTVVSDGGYSIDVGVPTFEPGVAANPSNVATNSNASKSNTGLLIGLGAAALAAAAYFASQSKPEPKRRLAGIPSVTI